MLALPNCTCICVLPTWFGTFPTSEVLVSCLLQGADLRDSALAACRVLLLQLYLFRGEKNKFNAFCGFIPYKYFLLFLC